MQAGNSYYDCDVPQMALMFSAAGTGVANRTRFAAKGIPDNQVENGELNMTSAFNQQVLGYMSELQGGNWGWVGKNLAVQTQRVLGLNAGVLRTTGLLGAVVGSYLTLLNVTSVNGSPISGSYRVNAIDPAGPFYTLDGLAAFSANAGGTVRLDEAIFIDYAQIRYAKVVVRKVGKPFGGYVGRR